MSPSATFKSTAPAFKAALFAALVANSDLADITVSYGAPTQGPREFIALADISGTQAFAALGKLTKEETFTLDVYVSVLREGNQQQQCTERCFEIAAELEDYLRANPTVGGTVRIAQLSAPFNLEEFAGDTARQSILTLGVEAAARI